MSSTATQTKTTTDVKTYEHQYINGAWVPSTNPGKVIARIAPSAP